MRKTIGFATVVVAMACTSGAALAVPTGTTRFTYQGQLKQSGVPVNDTCDVTGTLWNAATSGSSIAAPQIVPNVEVVNGLFTSVFDFGASVFAGAPPWLEIAVRCPAGAGNFTTLTPRKAITAAPFAIQTRGISVDDSGNVGIGTTNPQNHLDVEGGMAVGIAYSGTNAAPANGLIVQGSVGIGTTSPQAKLDVAGAVAVNGATVINAQGQWVGPAGPGAQVFASCTDSAVLVCGTSRYYNGPFYPSQTAINAACANICPLGYASAQASSVSQDCTTTISPGIACSAGSNNAGPYECGPPGCSNETSTPCYEGMRFGVCCACRY